MSNDAKQDRTLIATFAGYQDAHAAAQELKDFGAYEPAVYVDVTPPESEKSGFAGWWDSFFGSEAEADRRKYEEAMACGSAVVRTWLPMEKAGQAIEILNRHGAQDVETDADERLDAERLAWRTEREGGVRVYSRS